MPADLEAVLGEAQRRGLVGPGPLPGHVQHARGFLGALGAPLPRRCLDLGSGGGLPGLVLALEAPTSTWVLLDARRRATAFLTEAVEQLGLAARVMVLHARAEDAGRDPELRGTMGMVTARGFGPPAVVAECAAPFLVASGVLVVSEPPAAAAGRWSPAVLEDRLGLVLSDTQRAGGATYRCARQVRPCPDRYPRRAGTPAKRPLF